MKINSGVTGVIAAFGLFVAFAYAQQGGSQSDPGMQKSDESSQQMQQQEQTSSSLQDKQTLRQVQQALNDQGYKAGPADGKWGPKSQQALKKFQQAKGMEPTGQLNQEVITALGISPSGGAAGGQEGSMDQPSGAGGQQGDMSDQQSGAGGQQGDMSDQQSGAGGQGSMDQQSGAGGQQGSTGDQQGGSKY